VYELLEIVQKEAFSLAVFVSYMTSRYYRLFNEEGRKSSVYYRALCRLIALFGYASIKEIAYHLELPEKRVHNLLWYLVNEGILHKFPSDTLPQNFYCLSAKGRHLVKIFLVSNYISDWTPSRYNLFYQRHHRTVINVWSVFSKAWGKKLSDWVTEEQLRKEYTGKRARIFDAEFVSKQEIIKYIDGDWGKETVKEIRIVRCGLELETELKSARRYEKQITDMIEHIWAAGYRKEPISKVIFVCGGQAISDRLKRYLHGRYLEGARVYFIDLSELLVSKAEALVEDFKENTTFQLKDFVF